MDTQSLTIDLLEELDAFDHKWRDRYPTLPDAVAAAGPYALQLYRTWLQTDEAKKLDKIKQTRVNWLEVVERAKAQIAAERKMAAAARTPSADATDTSDYNLPE